MVFREYGRIALPRAAVGAVVALLAPGAVAQWTQNSPNIYFVSGRVGIGTTSPVHRLHVQDATLNGRAVYGWAQGGGFAVGITGVTSSTGGFGGYFLGPTLAVFARATGGNGTATYGAWGETSSSTGAGVVGDALALNGVVYGVFGRTVSPTGRAVYGESNASSGSATGVFGRSSSNSALAIVGVATSPTGSATGIHGQSAASGGTGIFGLAASPTGSTFGVAGRSISSDGAGVYGEAAASSGSTYGGIFTSTSPTGFGVWARTSSPAGSSIGVYGETAAANGFAIFGEASSVVGNTIGVFGHTGSVETGKGVWGSASGVIGEAIGVYGSATSDDSFAIFSSGRFAASGTKSFRIDHPLDPENRYLNHYCAEAPEPLNIYSGVVILDGEGGARVDLPEYFESINRDCRYSLTAVGAPMPMLHIAQEVEDGAFAIAGGAAGHKVSWEVKATRNDAWVRQHGAPAEQMKSEAHKGRFLHPELYNAPAGQAVYPEPADVSARPRPVAPALKALSGDEPLVHRRPVPADQNAD